MKKLLGLLGAIALCMAVFTPSVHAQSNPPQAVIIKNGTIAGSGQGVTVGAIGAQGTCAVTTTGTWSGTISFVVEDPQQFGTGAIKGTSLDGASGGTSTTSNITQWVFPCGGSTWFKAYFSAYSSGSAFVQITAAQATSSVLSSTSGGGTTQNVNVVNTPGVNVQNFPSPGPTSSGSAPLYVEAGPSTAPAPIGGLYQGIVDSNGHRSVNVCSSVNANCENVVNLPSASDGTAASSLIGTVVTSFCAAYNGSAFDRCRKDAYAAGPLWVTTGGSATASVPAGAGTTVVKASPGRISRGLVTASGTTGTLTCYDNASTGSGTVIAIFPGTTSVATEVTGTSQQFDTPAANGITCVGATNSPAVTISYY